MIKCTKLKNKLNQFQARQSKIAIVDIQTSLGKAERQYVLKHKLTPHPLTKPIQLSIQNTNLIDNVQKRQKLFDELLTQNCRILLQIKLIRIYPVFLNLFSNFDSKNKIPACSFRFILFHGEKISQVGDFKFNRQLNIHNCHLSTGKLGIFKINYQLTYSTYQMFNQIIRNQKIYIFLQNQFKMMTAIFQSNLSDLINDDQTLINKNFIKNLKFYQIGTNIQILSLECAVCLKKQIISPELIQLKQKFHLKRVLSKSPTRNRSPSPKLHKMTAQAVLKNKQKVIRIAILQNNEMQVLIYKKINKNENFRHENPKIEYSEYIYTYQIQSIEQNSQIYLKTKIIIQNGKKQGFMQLKMDNILIKITIKQNKLLKFLSLSESRKVFKTGQDCKNINAIIKLTENIYIRPDDDIKIIESLSEYKITKNSIASHNLKSNLNNPKQFSIEPANFIQKIINEKGVCLKFIVDSWILKNDELKVVIGTKANSIKQQQVDSLVKQIITSGIQKKLKGSIDPKDLKSHKIIKQLVQLHILNYKLVQQDVDVHLQLDVSVPGIYQLDTKSSLPKTGRVYITSSNDTILRVVKYKFDADKSTTILDVQLMQPISIKTNIILYVNNLTQATLTAIDLELNQLDYQNKYTKIN